MAIKTTVNEVWSRGARGDAGLFSLNMSYETEVVVGTYEEFLVGYKIHILGKDDVDLVQSFATRAHTGSVKSIAAVGRYLASGGADDKIVIHDMKTRTENKVLVHHEATVSAVAFTADGSHLLTGGFDGVFSAIRTGNWQTEKHWSKAHKGSAVTCISIHPSSKLALTIGDDKTLRTWNLIKGRQAYVTNLNSKGTANPLSVVWSPEGEHFSLTGYNDVSVWTISNAAVERVLKCPSKTVCMVWITEELTAVGLENGQIIIFDLSTGKKYDFDAHNQRVKGIAFDSPYLYSASSSGDIKVWEFDADEKTLIEKKCVNVGCRITCLTLVKATEVKKEDEEIGGESEVELINEDSESVNKKKKKRKNAEEVNVTEEIREGVVSKPKKNKLLSFVTVSVDKDIDNNKSETTTIQKTKTKTKIKKRNKKKNKAIKAT
ncbi:p21-activated protein kinase-interacting protein 1-like [Arctopsyche grandis]|uniref:p21-activated protein kinase-interacting protein 1-like n=1 Tax=Arctopsyche grandis TaxID=121162 RepID=UPI00406DA259